MCLRQVMALAAVCLLTSRANASPRSIPAQVFPAPFGVNIHFTQGKPGEVKALAAAYKVARMDFFWDRIEKVRGEYNFADYDILVKDLEENGVLPLFILDYGNTVYGPGPVRTEEQRKGYAAFAAAAVKHYKGHRILWEFWNEPNGTGFWGDRPDPEEYAAMVNEAGPAVRKADPDATLLLGAFSGFPWEYIETVFRRGCLKWADVVSVHPYRSGHPESAGADYLRLRRLIAQYSPKRDIPVISGEWGYSTNRKTGIPELRQAQYLVRQRLFNARSGALTSIWYDWKEDGPDPDENEHHFGSTHMDFSPKPAYRAAVTLTRTLAGYHFVRMLRDGPEEFVMLLRNSAGDSAIAFWSTGKDTNLRLPAAPKRIVGMLGEKWFATRTVPISPSPAYALFGRAPALDGLASWTFVKPNSVVVAGTPLKTAFTVRSTGPKAKVVDVAFEVQGGTVTPAKLHLTVNAGKVVSVPVTVDVWKRNAEAAVTVSIVSDGVKDTARIPLVVANPLGVALSGPTGAGFIVTLDAPGLRVPETLTVRRTGPGGKPEGQGVSIRLKPGIDSYSAPLRLPASPGTSPAYGVVLTDRMGREVASVPPMGFTSILPFGASAAGAAPAGIAVHAEGDEMPGGTVALSTAEDALRGRVAQIRAEFPDGWRYYVVTPEKVEIPDNAVAVGMWVKGDNCGDYIRVRIIDAKGQDYQPTFGPVDWTGWRWITMRLDDPAVGSWGGPQDGVIHRPIKWDSVFLLDSASRKAHTAALQIGDVTLMTR